MTRIRLTAMLAPVLLAVSTTRGEANGLEPVSLTLRFYNYAGATPAVVHSAQRKAARIFDRAAIEIVWLDCPTSPEQIAANRACSENPGPDHLILNLLPLSMSKKYRLKREVFGFALPTADGRPGNNLSLFFERVLDLAYHSAMNTSFEDSQAVILGHMIAHEVGHLLLGRNSHSGSGIMSFPWDKRTLTNMARARLHFSSEEQESIREEIARRIINAPEPPGDRRPFTAQEHQTDTRPDLGERATGLRNPTAPVRRLLSSFDAMGEPGQPLRGAPLAQSATDSAGWGGCRPEIFLNGQPGILGTCRPAPVSSAERAAALKTLPLQGAVSLFSEADRAKLAAVIEVLRFHRRDKIYDLKVIDVPQVWAGLHRRAVLLISRTALRLLQTEELQAVVAHEIGHEYVWREYDRATASGDRSSLRKLEAACDDVAVRTLWAMSIAPERLVRAIERVAAYNYERLGVRGNQENYPSLNERRRRIRALAARLNAK